MKLEKFTAGLISLVLPLVITLAGIGCLTTAFPFPIRDDTGILLPAVFCCTAYLLFAQFRGGGLIFGALFSLALGATLQMTELLRSVESLLYHITIFYERGYGWSHVAWSGQDLTQVAVDGGLMLVAALVSLVICRCIWRKKWVGQGLLAGLLPLFACCVVTDTIPESGWVWLLLTALVIFTLTHLSRRENTKNANRLLAWVLIPALLASSLLFTVSAPDQYEESFQGLRDTMGEMVDVFLNWLPDLERPSELNGDLGDPDLGAVGPQTPSSKQILKVTVQRTDSSPTDANAQELYYFRGRSYDTYTGTSWTNTLDTIGEGGWPKSGMQRIGSVSIETFSPGNSYYFAYYPPLTRLTRSMQQGALPNPDREQNYSFDLFAKEYYYAVDFVPLSDEEQRIYTHLKEHTLLAAQDILAQILGTAQTPVEKVEKIAEYVRNSATYDLNTPKMPTDQQDFVMWFLEQSETGYCTHFASAATVLLRAAGIPARYTVGYQVSMIPNATKVVTESQAHAWVEYLHPFYGWTVLEATPGFDDDPSGTEPTEPTTSPTETTEPTETTLPTETTEPTEATSSTGTHPTDQTNPTEETQDPGPGNQYIQWNLESVKNILWVLAVWVILAVQDKLRKDHRRKRMTQGDPNRQALVRWRYCGLLSRLTGVTTAPLLPLAEKAAFSQHTLTEAELSEFDAWIKEANRLLDKKALPIRILIRFVYAIE